MLKKFFFFFLSLKKDKNKDSANTVNSYNKKIIHNYTNNN